MATLDQRTKAKHSSVRPQVSAHNGAFPALDVSLLVPAYGVCIETNSILNQSANGQGCIPSLTLSAEGAVCTNKGNVQPEQNQTTELPSITIINNHNNQ